MMSMEFPKSECDIYIDINNYINKSIFELNVIYQLYLQSNKPGHKWGFPSGYMSESGFLQ